MVKVTPSSHHLKVTLKDRQAERFSTLEISTVYSDHVKPNQGKEGHFSLGEKLSGVLSATASYLPGSVWPAAEQITINKAWKVSLGEGILLMNVWPTL